MFGPHPALLFPALRDRVAEMFATLRRRLALHCLSDHWSYHLRCIASADGVDDGGARRRTAAGTWQWFCVCPRVCVCAAAAAKVTRDKKRWWCRSCERRNKGAVPLFSPRLAGWTVALSMPPTPAPSTAGGRRRRHYVGRGGKRPTRCAVVPASPGARARDRQSRDSGAPAPVT